MKRLGAILLLTLLWACTGIPAGLSISTSPAPTGNSISALPTQMTGTPAPPVVPEPSPSPATIRALRADPVKPQPGDAQLARGPVFLDSAELKAVPDRPDTAVVILKGSLPTPCHQLRAQAGLPDGNNRIEMDVFSVYDPNRMCAQVIVIFNQVMPVGALSPDRAYAIVANAQDMLHFHWLLP